MLQDKRVRSIVTGLTVLPGAVDGGGNYWGGEAWYGYGVGYYDNLAYRAQVRQKAQNAWQNWQAGRPAQLPGRRAGRRGGRR